MSLKVYFVVLGILFFLLFFWLHGDTILFINPFVRWSENFTSMLEEFGWVIHYEVDCEGREQITVDVPEDGGETVEKPWKTFLEENVPESHHELIRRNVLLATRNFQHRVEMFRKKILFGNKNPMKIRHISYRVEFQVSCLKVEIILWD